MHAAIDASLTYLRQHFLLRWTLANIAGWSVGLYLGSWLVSSNTGLIGVILAGMIAGLVVSVAQSIALGSMNMRWILLSTVAGALAAFPAYIAGFSLFVNQQVGMFIIGAIYGGIFGLAQYFAFTGEFRNGWWIAANIMAGGLCGCLSLASPLALPVFCSLGPLTFGLITGYVLLNISPNRKSNNRDTLDSEQ